MTPRGAATAEEESRFTLNDRNRVVIVADDYQFLDTVHASAPVVVHEWAVATSRERLIELTEPPPLAVVIDLNARSLDPIDALYLLGALSLSSRVVLLSGGDHDSLGSARRIAATLRLNVAGTLPRPLVIDMLLRLLAQHTQAAVTIESRELRVALREEQFFLNYQPIIFRDGERWSLRAAEALVRWQHPRRGLLYPSQFLGAVREARLMTAFTDFVMTQAIRQAGQWEAQQLDIGMAVNLPPRLVRDEGFAGRLLRQLAQFGVSPSRFALEVIETASVRDRELLIDAMTRVREGGVRLSLDDFGTGYSSLTELHRLPFSDLKIDRSLIQDVVHSSKAATIVTGIIEVAHRLSLRVCAEGVATAETFALLSEAGCDAMQGVHISRPAPAADVEILAMRNPEWALASRS